jgi:hypothetical protein
MAEHTRSLSEELRKTISYWFQIAAGLLGIFAIIAAFFVGKTWLDVERSAKETATAVAESTAKKAVEDYFKDHDKVRSDLDDIAKKYLASEAGQMEIRQEINKSVPASVSAAVASEVRRRVPDAVTRTIANNRLDQTIPLDLEQRFHKQLQAKNGIQVRIVVDGFEFRPTRTSLFASELSSVLTRAGIVVEIRIFHEFPGDPRGPTILYVQPQDAKSEVALVLKNLLDEVPGRHAEIVVAEKKIIDDLWFIPQKQLLIWLKDIP